jgi:hypothetical protein
LQQMPVAGADDSSAPGGSFGPAAAMEGGLLGSWSASRWQYSRRGEPVQLIDLVCDQRGNITLSLSQGTYVLAWDIPGNGSRSVGGACTVAGDQIEFGARGTDAVERVTFHLGSETLSLRCEASAWDFGGNGREEPADFVAVFVKL